MHNLNLIPKDILRERTYKRYKFVLRYVTVLILVLIVSATFYIDYKIALIDRQILIYNGNSEEIQEQCQMRELYKDRRQRISIYNNLMENRVIPSSIIKDIMTYKPREVLIFSVELKDKKLLEIQGKTYDVKYIGEMLNILQGLEYVTKTTLEFTQIQGEEGNLTSYYSFKILAYLKKEQRP